MYNDIDLNLEVDNNNENSVNVENLVNVSFESLIFPSRNLPPCFYNGNISENLENIYNSYISDEDILKENFQWQCGKIKKFYGYQDVSARVTKGVEPINFIFEKPSGGPRIFSIAHPLVQIPLHKYILDNVDDILEEQIEDNSVYCSNSKYYYQDGEIYVEYDYNGNELISSGIDTILQKKYKDAFMKKHILSRGKYYKLYLDISNFFHSIYTHTISWEVSEDKKDIFDNLDMLMRTQNNNETKGIIIGPYSSGLFAEIIMSKIDKKMLDFIKNSEFDVSYVRYVDDIEMYSDNKNELEKCLSKIEKELLKYKLDVNHSKTSICEFPFLQMITQSSKNIYHLKERLLSNKYDDDLEKIEDIIMEINNSLNNGHSNAKYLLSILKNLIIDNDIFDGISDQIMWILIDYLLNVIFKYQILTENVSLLIIAILDKYEQIDKVKFIDNAITKRNSKKDTTKEIVDIWITYIITLFNLESNAINNYFKLIINESDICAIMILNYYHRNNSIEENKASIKDYLDSIKTSLKSKYDTNWLNASWLSKHWLLFYLNETKWSIDEINGFKDTILADVKLDKLLADDTLSTRLNIFNIMRNLDIDVLNYENTR